MRTKLGAVLIIPSVAFLVLAGAQTKVLIGQANVLGEFAQQVGVGREITSLIHELQRERDQTAGELAGLRAAPTGRTVPSRALAALEAHYPVTDQAIDRFRAAAPLIDSDVSWRVSHARADEALNQLPELRAAMPAAAFNPNMVLGSYNRAIDALLALLAEPSPGVDRPELTEAVLRYVRFAQLKEIGSRIQAQLYAAAGAGKYGPEDLVTLTDLRAQQLTALADFRDSATAWQLERYREAAAHPDFLAAATMEESTIASGDRGAAVLEPVAWWAASQQRHELLRQVESAVLGAAVEQAEARSAQQLWRTMLTAGAVLAVLLAALLTSVVIGRSIARSLRVLRGQALNVAQVELPDTLERLRAVNAEITRIEVPPAPVRSMDEIGEVAEAFVAVHRSAVTVAIEQAITRRNVNAMFVNLARRSQVLVERQLELLDELERDESDPDQLENLFRLDHLAARMRRNDDSLLVLAGTEPSRRWSRPVSLTTVLLAAVAEIEQYQRVRHQVDGQLYVVGHAVADLVHLLAELLENASAFSRPDTLVRISGWSRRQDAVVIEIADQGLGMSPTALDEANGLLAAPSAADLAASERMGLFVVSHLAARQGVRVRLRAVDRGIVAEVRLPVALLAPVPEELPDRPVPARIAVLMGGGGAARDGLADTGPVADGSGSAGSAEPPLVGRRPGVITMRRTARRELPTRAEDVIGAATGDSPTASTWWSRQPSPAPTVAPPMAAAVPPRPVVPVPGGINRGGLPVRVPMAQLPTSTEPKPAGPVQRDEPDPEAMGGMLSRLYSGIRRAEAEETNVISMAPIGARNEEEQK